MTETQTPATQAQLDEMTYNMYVDCNLNKAATAREMGISASTVADRVKRHSLRLAQADIETRETAEDAQAQDDAGEPEPQAPVTEVADNVVVVRPDSISEFVANATAAATEARDAAMAKEQQFTDALLGVMSGAVTVDQAYENLTGERAGDVVDEFTAEMNTQAAEALARGEDTYAGPVCPVCNRIAYAGMGGHEPGCKYGRIARAAITAGPAAGTMDDTQDAAQAHVAEVIANATEVPAQPEVAAEGGEPGEVDHCVKCGWDFGHMTTQQTCGSERMCLKRQALGDPTFGRRTPKAS